MSVTDLSSLREFCAVRSRVDRHAGSCPDSPAALLPLVLQEGPFAEDRLFHFMLARRGGKAAGRVSALVDRRYNRQHCEQRGHLILLEVLPGEEEAAAALIDTATAWLADQHCSAVRSGFGPFEPGYRGGPDDLLCSLLLENEFRLEKSAQEYTALSENADPARYRSFLSTARAGGYTIVPLANLDARDRVTTFTSIWNQCYADHWGLAATSEAEFALVLGRRGERGAIERSAIAFNGSLAVGAVLGREESPETGWRGLMPLVRHRRHLADLAFGVLPEQRGHGLALALAAHVYLGALARGENRLPYGLVLEDNVASRRVAEKLGASPGTSFLTYARPLSSHALQQQGSNADAYQG